MKSFRAGWAWSMSQVNAQWWLRAGLGCALATLLGLVLEHRAAAGTSRDSTLLVYSFGLALPLVVFAASSRVFPEGLVRGLGEIAAHGANRRHALLGVAAHLTAGACGLVALSSLLAVVLGASPSASGLADAFACLWIAGLGAAGYTAWFLLGSSIGRGKAARWLCLAGDWTLGSGISSLAAPWPRAHLRNLLGGQPVANLEQGWTAGLLGLLVAVYLTLALLRTPR